MAKTGRPRRNSIEAFAAAIDACIAAYEESGNPRDLSDSVLLSRLKISPQQLDRYYSGEIDAAVARTTEQSKNDGNNDGENDGNENTTKRTYEGELKRLKLYRSAECIQHITQDRSPTGWIFLSKQPRWGGFADVQKAETTGRQEITVTVKGADGRELH